MSNGDLFYVFGIAVAVSAVLVSLAGLRLKDFPGRFGAVVALWFIVLVGGATTFAVLHAQDEEHEKAAELAKAGEEVEEAEVEAVQGGAETEGEAGEEAASEQPAGKGGAATTLTLAADPTQIAFDTTSLTAKAGEVTIDFDNPAALEHNVAIEQDGKEIATSPTITEGKTSVSADLEPGTYTFLCTVPGHAEAGMEGTLTVQ
ncbi:MAG TPA: plastocyanin/azurin family copper-binding protein [Solirubrobacterales bacterium]|nr:plastocyanin/azurin family copper-binding protein [Solirubrobacterales bacterium]